MKRRIRIPFLVDLVLIDNPDQIRSVSKSECLDRKFDSTGPLLNRVIARRIRSTLSVNSRLLPSALPRADDSRVAAQAALAEKLSAIEIPALLETPAVSALAAAVSGDNSRPLGHLVQEFIGGLFVPSYTADEGTWTAAEHLDAAVRSNNPILRLLWRLSGTTQQAQRALSDAVNGNLSGVHATGIAVHTLYGAIERLRDFYNDPTLRTGMTPAEAAGRSILAPKSVMRQADVRANASEKISDEANIGALDAGTLVQLKTRSAGVRTLDPDIIFMRDSWSYCPAHNLVPALLVELWTRATAPIAPIDAQDNT